MSSALTQQIFDVAEPFVELYRPHRYKVLWGGRDGAKSWGISDAILLQASRKPMRILCAREIQRSIKDSVHSLLKNRIKALGLSQYFKVLNNEIRGHNGSEIIYAGLWQNVENIKSIDSVDICWVEEANTVSDESWKKLIPSIRKPGSEIIVSFNPELKMDPAYQRFVVNPPPNSYVRQVSFRDNPWLSDESKAEIAHLRATNEDEYRHVYEGELKEFADGAVFGKQLKQARDDDRITSVPIESLAVNTFWDLGRNDTTAIWFHQQVGLQNRFIDYYEHRLVDLDHYAKVLQDKGYIYGEHYLPHDVEVTVLGSGNRSRLEILEGLGVLPIQVVPRIDSVNNGIEQTRTKFASCWFDEKRCEKGLDALANYQYVWDEKWETFRQSPVHNWASNGADAFRQFGQAWEGIAESINLNFSSEW